MDTPSCLLARTLVHDSDVRPARFGTVYRIATYTDRGIDGSKETLKRETRTDRILVATQHVASRKARSHTDAPSGLYTQSL